MGLMDNIKQQAGAAKKRIVLPEGTEERTLRAAEIISREGIAEVILIGNPSEIGEKSKGLDLSNVKIIDSVNSKKLKDYAFEYYNLRKHKGVTQQKAEKQLGGVPRKGV